MKIGILTFTEGTNIGQRLQNYALQHVLEEQGHQVMTIRQTFPFGQYKKMVKDGLYALRHPHTAIKLRKREYKFRAFNKEFIKFYNKKLPFQGDNTWVAKKFDAFVVGSDQIWNPRSPFVGDNYFLTFANRRQRVTYAPSFSVESVPDNKQEKFRKYLSGFDSITVREDKGADIVKQLTGKNAVVVLDPTLLLSKKDWDKVKKSTIDLPKDRYILSVFLGSEPEASIKVLAQQLGNTVFQLNNMSNISPAELLYVLENAALVATDSYHITVFSIIYHRPFVNFARSNGANMESRFDTLYRLLGLKNRNWKYLKEHMDEVLNVPFGEAKKHIEKERERSLKVLQESLAFSQEVSCRADHKFVD